MSNIDSSFRTPFFPNSKSKGADSSSISRSKSSSAIGRNSYAKANEIAQRTSGDARVSIPDAVRDFSRIKKAVDAAPPIDNTDKIAALKAKIQAGTYEMDYDAIADKILSTEF